MRDNALRLQAMRDGDGKKDHRREEAEEDYEAGVAKIRGDMMGNVKENRNHKRYRKGSDSE